MTRTGLLTAAASLAIMGSAGGAAFAEDAPTTAAKPTDAADAPWTVPEFNDGLAKLQGKGPGHSDKGGGSGGGTSSGSGSTGTGSDKGNSNDTVKGGGGN